MLSQNNNIYEDIRELLGTTDVLTPEMERVLSVMSHHRPHVVVDEAYRQKLKESLMRSEIPMPQKWYFPSITKMTWMGTSFAAILITLGIIRIFSGNIDTIPTDTIRIPTVQSPVVSLVSSGKSIESEPRDIQKTNIAVNHQNPILERKNEKQPMKNLASPGNPPTNRVVPTGEQYALLDQAPMAVGGTYPAKSGLTGAGEMGAMAMPMTKRSADNSTSESLPEVDTAVQDIIWEINTLIQESTPNSGILPDYPGEMSIYIKNHSPFTTDERSLLAGSGITSQIVSTYSRETLRGIIGKYQENILVNVSPVIRYTSYAQGEQNLLVPTLVYTTITGSTLTIPLIPGY